MSKIGSLNIELNYCQKKSTTSMLPSGVGDLQYSIILSGDSIWAIPNEDLITIIKAMVNG